MLILLSLTMAHYRLSDTYQEPITCIIDHTLFHLDGPLILHVFDYLPTVASCIKFVA